MTLFIVFVWFVFAIVVGSAARSRNRSGFNWFLLSLFVSPLLTTVWLFILPKRSGLTRNEQIEQLRSLRQCPSCAETVKREAKICKHCHRDLPDPEPLPALPERQPGREFGVALLVGAGAFALLCIAFFLSAH